MLHFSINAPGLHEQAMQRRIPFRDPQPLLPLQLWLPILQHICWNQMFPIRIQQARNEHNGMCVQSSRPGFVAEDPGPIVTVLRDEVGDLIEVGG